MKIVMMGSPEFASPSLERLVFDGFEVLGVFTQPDKPVGRKAVSTPPPLKLKAESLSLRVYQPGTLRGEEGEKAFRILEALAPDLIAVAAYGKILPKRILDIPKYGCLNIHASILPKLRGAAPIQWAIIRGETQTGVSAMKMSEGLDEGDVYGTKATPIYPDETAEDLSLRLSKLGAELLSKTIEDLKNGRAEAEEQDGSKATYAPILNRSYSPIDWSLSAQAVHNRVRGLYPWPAALGYLDKIPLKIFRSKLRDGGRIIPAADFLRGRSLDKNSKFGKDMKE